MCYITTLSHITNIIINMGVVENIIIIIIILILLFIIIVIIIIISIYIMPLTPLLISGTSQETSGYKQ